MDQVRQRLDARDVLEHYGAQNIYEAGNELIHSCVVDQVMAHHTHGDSAPSAALNQQTLLFNCFSFGGGDVLWLVQQMEECDREQAVSVIEGLMAPERDLSLEELRERIQKSFAEPDEEEPIPRYNDNVLAAWRFIHPHLVEDRGLSPTVLQRYRVGYDESENKIVIPHFVAGRLVGWQKRVMDHPRWPRLPGYQHEPKYKMSPSFPKYQTIFNPQPDAPEVVVMESAISVLKWESWREGNDYLPPAVSTFSSGVSDTQAAQLRSHDTVTIFFDWDYAGIKGALRLTEMLINYVNVRVVLDPPDGKDPDELSAVQASFCYERARPGVLAIPHLERLAETWKSGQQRRVSFTTQPS
jgi:DNA primase